MTLFISHDENLFKKIYSIFNQDLQYYLQNFDFANTGRTIIFDAFFEMLNYIDTIDYQFIDIDDEFKHVFEILKDSMNQFNYFFTVNTTPTGINMFQVASQSEWDTGDFTRYRKEADDLNNAARALYQNLEIFIIEGKKRTPMKEEKPVSQTINYNGNIHGVASVGHGNTIINNTNKFDEELYKLLADIKNSSLQDRDVIVHQLEDAQSKNDKSSILKILGGLLTRGNEAAGFIASIGTIMSL